MSPKIVAAEKPRALIASATWVACSTPAQKASQLRRSAPSRTTSSIAASVMSGRSTAACSWPGMNSPPRLPTPLTSSLVSAALLTSGQR